MSPSAARAALFCSLVLTAQGCASANAHNSTAPASAAVSTEKVLPGFEPLRRDGNRIDLYARQIRWDDGLLPNSFDALSSRLADISLVITDTRGRETVLGTDALQWLSTSPTRAEYEASTRWSSLVIHLHAAVEYDGVVDVTLSLTPSAPVDIRDLRIDSRVKRSEFSEVLGFRAQGIRKQKDRKDFLELPYRGDFVHAVTVADGNRSFWWFADNNRGWKRQGSAPVTEVFESPEHITIRQHIVAGAQRLTRPTSMRFGLLATPVRAIEPERRVRHATAKGHSRKERDMGTAYKIWWPTALAYDAYPYTSYVDDRADRLEPSERKGYPGLEYNIKRLRIGRSEFDFHWLPYFSAHALSMLDPQMAVRRADWEVLPRKVFRDGLRPYKNTFDKPVVTHNAPGYSEYVLSRVDALIDEMDLEGIYLDHGPPHDSANPRNGGWKDEEGNWQPSLDIFALRDYMKKLRTLFIDKGRAGYTFIHISNREIMPAYTFAYAVLDGEQHRKRVRDGRYLDYLSLDEFRTRFSGHQYGVPNYWLYIDWTNHRGNKNYKGSPRQTTDTRRTLALAMLHDLPMWHHTEDVNERQRVNALTDRLPFDKATFVGYWNELAFVSTSNDDFKISQYRYDDKIMNVVVNTSGERATTRLRFNDESADCRVQRVDPLMSGPAAQDLRVGADNSITLPAYESLIVSVRVTRGCVTR